MKNNKGFTLIEVISILVLIAIVATLSFQVVANRIKKSKQRLKETLYETIEQAANKYMLANPSLDKYHTSRLCIEITTLQNNGFLETGDIKNPETNELINSYKVLAEYESDSKQYKYDVVQSCTPITTPIISDDLVETRNLVVSSGDGLYEDSDSYVFKGTNPNNYLSFNNKLWRIISIDKETKFVKIMSTTSVGEGYQENGVIPYLNASYETDYNSERRKLISTNSKWNTGVIDSTSTKVNIIKSLEKQQNSYYTVGLLSMSDYLNSFIGDNSYLKNGTYFLSNKTSSDNLWILNNNSLVAVQPSNSPVSCKIYPVIYLNLNARISEGNGSQLTPYKID